MLGVTAPYAKNASAWFEFSESYFLENGPRMRYLQIDFNCENHRYILTTGNAIGVSDCQI